MKKFLCLYFFLMFTMNMSAQDKLMLKTGEEIECKITELSAEDLKYKKLSNLDGPAFVLSLNDVLFIQFANGEKMIPEVKKSSETIIPAGTEVILETQEFLTAKTAEIGQLFEMTVHENVYGTDGTTILIAAGTRARGRVTNVKKNKSLGRAGTLSIDVTEVNAIDQTPVRIRLNYSEEGENRGGAAIGVGALLFWPALLIKGEAPEIPIGTLLPAVTTTSTELHL